MQPGREDRKKAFFESPLIFGTAGALPPPSSNLATILAVIAFAIPVRPLLLANTKSDESLLLDLAINFAAWIVVICLYKYASRHSLKQWWIITSGLISWLSLLATAELIYIRESTTTWIFFENNKTLKEIIRNLPSIFAAVFLIFALLSKGKKKVIFYITSLSMIIGPLLWFIWILYLLFARKFF